MKKTLITCMLMGLSLWLSAQDTILPYPIDTVNGTAVYRYTPEKSIGLYRISVNFGLPMGEILQWNPQLEKRGPQLTDVLLIPVKQTIIPTTKKEESSTHQPASTAPAIQPSTPASTKENNTPIVETFNIVDTPPIQTLSSSVIRIAVILPLHAKAITRENMDDRFYDFYAGVLLAIRQYEKFGQKFEIHTYDVDRSDTQLQQLRQDSFIHHAHAIIGPVYTPQIEEVAKITQNSQCIILSPFSSNIPSIATNPNILQFNPTTQMEAQTMANHIIRNAEQFHCLMLEGGEADMSPYIKKLYQLLTDNQVPLTRIPLHTILNDSIGLYLKQDKENLFIFHKDKYSNLNVILPSLTRAAETNRLTLLSHYTWEKEQINMPQLYTSVFHSLSDSLSAGRSIYQKNFDYYFGHTPASVHPHYDLLGYDLTLHLVLLLQQLSDIADPSYRDHILSQPFTGIQENIHYQKVNNGGYINHSISIVHP